MSCASVRAVLSRENSSCCLGIAKVPNVATKLYNPLGGKLNRPAEGISVEKATGGTIRACACACRAGLTRGEAG